MKINTEVVFGPNKIDSRPYQKNMLLTENGPYSAEDDTMPIKLRLQAINERNKAVTILMLNNEIQDQVMSWTLVPNNYSSNESFHITKKHR